MNEAQNILITDGAPSSERTAVVVGNFDGVHRGHQVVLHAAVEAARESAIAPVVLTFDPHPSEVLGRGAPPKLTTLARRAELVARFGIRAAYVHPFDREFASWTPERFARELLRDRLRAALVLVGDGFRFGAKRAGDLAMLADFGKTLGFDVRSHAISGDDAGAFSSTRARVAVDAGDVTRAAEILGRPHSTSGVVAHGDARGRTIGFPTANFDVVPEILPANGVYAVVVDLVESSSSTSASWHASALAKGVANIGVRPTVGGGARRLEVHLFDFDRDLYGSTLRVHFVSRLRGEVKFDGLAALKTQIAKDAEAARESLRDQQEVDGAYG